MALKDVWTSGREPLRGLSLELWPGEIVGVAGVEGNGQRDLAETIVGLKHPRQGRVLVLGQDVSGAEPDDVVRLGVGFVAEDRQSALVLDLSIKENLILRSEDRRPFSSGGTIDQRRATQHARKLIADFAVAGGQPNVAVRTLSGGNQQKVVLARELHRQPRVLIAAQPTRGLDVAATAYVRSLILQQRARDGAVLYISSDLDEILEVSDRIAVILAGRIIAVVPASEVRREEIGLLMAGVGPA